MRFKMVAIALAAVLSIGVVAGSPAQAATPKAGAACAKAGITQVVKAGTKTTKFTCVKSGKKLVWNKGVVTIAKPGTPNSKPTNPSGAIKPATKASLKSWNAPPIYDLRIDRKLSFNFTLDTNGEIDQPEVAANFIEPNKTWEVPAQSISIKAIVTPVATAGLSKTYSVSLSIDDRQALGVWSWSISPIKARGKEIGLLRLTQSQAKFEFRRSIYGASETVPITSGALFKYQSFKGESSELYPWEGKNLVLLTKTNSLSPEIIGRIVSTLDKVFDSYSSITQYQPKPARTYHGKLSIAVLPSTDIGCGAACGYLGATGIEISQPLFNRLYNGVERFDQYDQALFYELGRNFWDYAGLQRVLTRGGNGTWDTDPFWDAATTGFAVYMRAVTAEINNVPMQPWDGNNSSWSAFLGEMKGLAYKQKDSADKNFSNTFQSKKSPAAGPLGITDFWASVMFYFAEGKDIELFTRTFIDSIKKQRTPTSTSQVVENFVNSLSAAAGNDISDVFYKTLRFEDAQNLP